LAIRVLGLVVTDFLQPMKMPVIKTIVIKKAKKNILFISQGLRTL